GQPMAQGIHQGRLAPCPSSPNCVSSQAGDLAPLPLPEEGPAEAIARLAAVIGSMKGSEIVERTDEYLHATFRSTVGFTDDVEFCAEPGTGHVHFRSAARSGWYDFGVNKRRMEKIRRLYMEK
ncbi:MAG: DUF1499 domain-containing protein, partial [Pseudomonadota bacterium]